MSAQSLAAVLPAPRTRVRRLPAELNRLLALEAALLAGLLAVSIGGIPGIPWLGVAAVTVGILFLSVPLVLGFPGSVILAAAVLSNIGGVLGAFLQYSPEMIVLPALTGLILLSLTLLSLILWLTFQRVRSASLFGIYTGFLFVCLALFGWMGLSTLGAALMANAQVFSLAMGGSNLGIRFVARAQSVGSPANPAPRRSPGRVARRLGALGRPTHSDRCGTEVRYLDIGLRRPCLFRRSSRRRDRFHRVHRGHSHFVDPELRSCAVAGLGRARAVSRAARAPSRRRKPVVRGLGAFRGGRSRNPDPVWRQPGVVPERSCLLGRALCRRRFCTHAPRFFRARRLGLGLYGSQYPSR